ncbi:lantibiotic dehydratase [Nocardiopsis sp. CNT-189]|uniref:lantibiotic dehydratase n=1 Tax=Nocardiopsis oceanisediminis TaxID=2816862 RepID=UPI003B2D265A
MGEREKRYRVCAAMVRATTAEGDPAPPSGIDPDEAVGAQQLRSWSKRLWSRPVPDAALRSASPVLHRRLAKVHGRSGEAPLGRRETKALLSSAAFALRWRHRPTPAGLFAGIAPLALGPARAAWGEEHRLGLRPGSEWLAGVIDRLLAIPELRWRAPVLANPCVHPRGGRLVAPGKPADEQAVQAAPVEVSVRRSAPAAAALEAARTPIAYGELADRIGEGFPRATEARTIRLLDGLLEQGLLLEGVWAPMGRVDAQAHLLEVLTEISAAEIPEAKALIDDLDAVHRELGRDYTTADPASLAEAVRRMRHCHRSPGGVLAADTALQGDIAVPSAVGREAERAAELFLRLTPFPYGAPHWHDYHRRFRDRYGPGAAVPLLALVGDGGLGFPAGFLDSPHQMAPRPHQARDAVLLELVQQALMSGEEEIVLGADDLDRLTAGGTEAVWPDRVELSAAVHVGSLQALQGGDFLLEVTGVPRPASSMAGRFLHLLEGPARTRWAGSYQSEDGALSAQVSFVPRRRANSDITRTLSVLPFEVALSHHGGGDGVLTPRELCVVADARGFGLVHAPTGRAVQPRVLHALEAGTHTPSLARFIAELPLARCAWYTAFDAGAAKTLPYLPRIRCGRTVLAPARWRLKPEDLPRPGSTTREWEQALQHWRRRLQVPDRVAMVEHDQRLPLDLGEPLHRRLLRTAVQAGGVELRERLDRDGGGWAGRAHEVLFALKTTGKPHRPAYHPPPAAEEEPAPLLHARLDVHPARIDELLTGHCDTFGELAEAWWFQRDTPLSESRTGLLVTLRLSDPAAWTEAARHLADWAHRLQEDHLLGGIDFTSRTEHTGRFGHGPAMRAAHGVFAADSAAAITQIRTAQGGSSQGRALAAAGMVAIAEALAPTPEQGRRWLTEDFSDLRAPVARTEREHARHLLAPGSAARDTRSGLGRAWEQRREALARYREHLSAQRDPRTVLRSLLHQHHRRALGPDPDRERSLLRLARDCARSLHHWGR